MNHSFPDDHYVCSKTAAKIIGVKGAGYLEKDRHEAKKLGRPPLIPYIQLGRRNIKYKVADLHAHMAAHRVAT